MKQYKHQLITITILLFIQLVCFQVVAQPSFTLSAITQNRNCSSTPNGVIDLTVDGPSTYYYLWSTGDTTEDLSGLDAGTYQVIVRDQNNTTSVDSAEIEIFYRFKTISKILAPDGMSNDEFGAALAIRGNRAIIAALYDNYQGIYDGGSAYIYETDGSEWSMMQKIVPSDGASNDQFGLSVDIDGNWAIVGSWYDDDNGSNSGSAYIFEFDGVNWIERQKILASDGVAYDEFGISVSIEGTRVLIGAPNNPGMGIFSVGPGAAYVFEYNGTNWSETQKLLAADGIAGDQFGYDLKIEGNTIIIGAPFADVGSGSVYVYEYNGVDWIQTQKLLASDAAAFDRFGNALDISGDRLIVGAPFKLNGGQAYIFHYSGSSWVEMQKGKPSDVSPSDNFGSAVSISGNRAVVGSRLDDDQGISSGSAYVFDFNGTRWNQTQKLLAFDGSPLDGFGRPLSMDNNQIFIGSYYDDNENGVDAGSVYAYDLCTYQILCMPPVSISTSNIASTKAKLNWSRQGAALGYVIVGGPLGGNVDSFYVVGGNASTSKTFNYLNPGTTFQWSVFSVCGVNMYSPLSIADTFSTPPCTAPNPISSSNITSSSVKLNWTPQPGAVGYIIYGGEIGGTIVSLNASGGASNNLTISNLPSSTTYHWTVVTACGTGKFSPTPAADTFTTLNANNAKWMHANESMESNQKVSIYPNPTKGTVHIMFSEVMEETEMTIEVIDVTGTPIMLEQSRVNDRAVQLKLDHVINGVYFILIRNNGVSITRKLIVAK